MIKKHSKKTLSLFGVLAASAIVLSACSGTASPETSKDVGLKVAILTSGAVSDNGYNADAKRAADLIESKFGGKVALSESVPVPSQSDVYRQFATQGYDLVIGWGGQFTDGAVEISAAFPKVKFLVVNSNASNGTNLASFDQAVEQWSFMAGWLQAKLTKSGTIGWVGAQCFPATAAGLHGTEQGARFVNPAIDIKSTFTGDFEDPTKANQAAKAMIETGVDVLSGNLNNAWPGVYEAAKTAGGVQAITEWIDNSSIAPDIIVSSVLKSLVPFVEKTVQSVVDDNFKGEFTMYPVPQDWGPILSETKRFDAALYQEALGVQKKIVDGDITVKRDETCS